MKKVLLGIVIVGLLAAVGITWKIYSERDNIIAKAIRTYGPELLGVSVKLEGVTTDVANQSAELRGLVVGNPEGFTTPHAVSVDVISMKLDIASLTKDVILIKEVSIVNPDIHFENKPSGSNLEVILQNVKKSVAAAKSGADGEKAGKDQGPGKKVTIENFYIRDAIAKVTDEKLKRRAVSVSLPEIHMTDIGANGAGADEVTQQIMDALTLNVTKTSNSLLSGGPLEDIRKRGDDGTEERPKRLRK